MHTFAPHIDVLLHVSRPSIRRGQPTFFAFGTCGGDAERVVAPSEGSEIELNFWKDTSDAGRRRGGSASLVHGELANNESKNIQMVVSAFTWTSCSA